MRRRAGSGSAVAEQREGPVAPARAQEAPPLMPVAVFGEEKNGIGTLCQYLTVETAQKTARRVSVPPPVNHPEAAAASKTMVVGFTDMFTPSILAASTITSNMTRFIVAVVSVTQLIYLSEVGGLILGSKIPVNLPELFVLFLERTVISLVIASAFAHMIF